MTIEVNRSELKAQIEDQIRAEGRGIVVRQTSSFEANLQYFRSFYDDLKGVLLDTDCVLGCKVLLELLLNNGFSLSAAQFRLFSGISGVFRDSLPGPDGRVYSSSVELLEKNMLPEFRDQASSLIEATLVGYLQNLSQRETVEALATVPMKEWKSFRLNSRVYSLAMTIAEGNGWTLGSGLGSSLEDLGL